MPLDTRALLSDVNAWAQEVFEDAVLDMALELDGRVPVAQETRLDSGPSLRDSQQVNVAQGRATIRYPKDYASYTDEGTPPHPIVGNPLLAFHVDGDLVIVHSVNHPGTPRTGWWSDLMTDQEYRDALVRAAAGVRF